MSKIVALVTGASGFIGRHVCRELRHRGIHTVAVIRPGGRNAEADASVLLGDDPSDVDLLVNHLEALRPDIIFHLAGAKPGASLLDLYRTNVVYGAALIDALERLRLTPVILFAGSAAEYGPVDPSAQPVSESLTCKPVTGYGISKLAQTHHALAAKQARIVVARLFNPIGPGMPHHLALGRFASIISAMGREGGELPTGPLNAVRDFSNVADVARCLVALVKTPAAYGQIVNVCSGRGTSLRDLLNLLISASSKQVTIAENAFGGSATHAISTFIGSPTLLNSLGIAAPGLDAERAMIAIALNS